MLCCIMDILHWHSALWFVFMLIWPEKIAKSERTFTGVNTLIREYIGRTTTEKLGTTMAGDGVLMVYPDRIKQSLVQQKSNIQTSKQTLQKEIHTTVQHGSLFSAKLINILDNPLDNPTVNAVQFAPQPQGVKVTPLPLAGSDHELSFNVTWDPPTSPTVQTYSLEVHSASNTLDCRLLNFCYESNIPGDSLWSVIPAYASPDADGCAVKPGCAYLVKLMASPWDGHTYANLHVELDECVEGVCSCAHAPRLPAPVVSASTISIQGELFVNVSWSLPVPMEPLRLPPRLRKEYYFISVGKEIVKPSAHRGPAWYPHIVTRRFDAIGFVVVPDKLQWRLLPITERGGDRNGERSGQRSGERFGERRGDGPVRSIVLDVKLEARVSLVDERGCAGPAGNATAYDPTEPKTPVPVPSFQFQALWAAFGGTCVLAMVAILAFSARAVKRVLKEFRPEPVPAALQPLRPRPNWFPLDG